MAEVRVDLNDGLTVGIELLKTAYIRTVDAGMVIDANEESEKLVYSLDETGRAVPTLVPSPTLVGVHVLRRQIVRLEGIGKPYSGPLSLDELKSLSAADLNLIQAKANELDNAVDAKDASRSVTHGGRPDAGDGTGE